MPATSTQPTVSASTTPRRSRFKPILWSVMGAMTLLVIFYSEVRLLRQPAERAYLRTIPFLIVPHVIGGIAAFLIGPLQFSDRFRRHSPGLHRILGRIYVVSVFVAAPLAILLSAHSHDPKRIHWVIAVSVQSTMWVVTTLAAFLTAWNRHFQQHKLWMMRSYAVTFTFVLTRVLQPIPAWNRHSETGFSIEVIIITFLAIMAPDFALSWHAFTTRRAA